MRHSRIRVAGLSMTAFAVLTLCVLQATLLPEPVLALACCQECEAQEAACYDSCYDADHNVAVDDSLDTCYDACDAELYDSFYGCWTHCMYCSPPKESTCYTFVLEHEYSCETWNEDHTECLLWKLVPGQDAGHVFMKYQTGDEWCSSY